MENKSTTGWLCKDPGFKEKRLFLDSKEYAQAKAEGWNTGPADAAKAKREAEKEVKEPDFFDVSKPEDGLPVEPKRKLGRPKRKG